MREINVNSDFDYAWGNCERVNFALPKPDKKSDKQRRLFRFANQI